MAASLEKEYQHFIPQFLLRNFSHPYNPENGTGGRRQRRRNKQSGPKYEKGMFPGDPVVRCVDLLTDPPVIRERPVKHVLGMTNMYNDTTKPTGQQREVETLLSQLEARASQIFRKMTMAFEKKEAGVWLTRTERDLLRKFLFMQLYRASGFHKRFCHDSPEDYNENDKVLFREYMAEHGYKRPMDVWLHSIKTIIQLKMDPEKKWMTELHERMYPGDAVWFIGHVQFYYTAICTPSHADQEFILTSNGFGVFEGSNRFVRDYDTGEVGCAGHTPLHYFAPVSPKLMIILRARTFPEVIKHADDEARALWEEQRRLALGVTIGYDGLLADLPVEMPENNYTTVGTDGRLYGSDGEYWRPRSDHRFCLRLFEIGSEHVNRINAILLDNCWGVDPSTAVVFDSHEAFVKTLEWYLTAPCDIGKVIQGVGADVRESALMKLEALSRSLGSQKTTEWVKRREPTMHNYEGYVQSYIDRYRALHKMAAKSEDGGGEALEETIPPEPGSAHHIYLNLLGKLSLFFSDCLL